MEYTRLHSLVTVMENLQKKYIGAGPRYSRTNDALSLEQSYARISSIFSAECSAAHRIDNKNMIIAFNSKYKEKTFLETWHNW